MLGTSQGNKHGPHTAVLCNKYTTARLVQTHRQAGSPAGNASGQATSGGGGSGTVKQHTFSSFNLFPSNMADKETKSRYVSVVGCVRKPNWQPQTQRCPNPADKPHQSSVRGLPQASELGNRQGGVACVAHALSSGIGRRGIALCDGTQTSRLSPAALEGFGSGILVLPCHDRL